MDESKGILLKDTPKPGLIALFGSGETTTSGRKIFAELFRTLPDSPNVAILETPAGFELNSSQVAGHVGDFLQHHLQNFKPQITQVPARKRETALSPNNPDIVAPILEADMVFMGPGSPTYAVRQLRDSLAWDYLIARYRLGAGLALASAAAIAISAYALPVYEIFKVGEDIHWKEGLDFFGAYGLSLVFIPHWNNRDGGEGLDTSRCFIGRARFAPLINLLPDSVTVLGIDERTGLIIDLWDECFRVIGDGRIHVIRDAKEKTFSKGVEFPIAELGTLLQLKPEAGVPPEIWKKALGIQRESKSRIIKPEEVKALIMEREAAREEENWEKADAIRERILEMGWQVKDTPHGTVVKKIDSSLG
jgi:cyanophycinase-like exopeptidase